MALPLFAVLDAQALIAHIEHQLNGSRCIDKTVARGSSWSDKARGRDRGLRAAQTAGFSSSRRRCSHVRYWPL